MWSIFSFIVLSVLNFGSGSMGWKGCLLTLHPYLLSGMAARSEVGMRDVLVLHSVGLPTGVYGENTID
jgi:hypothetical protein